MLFLTEEYISTEDTVWEIWQVFSSDLTTMMRLISHRTIHEECRVRFMDFWWLFLSGRDILESNNNWCMHMCVCEINKCSVVILKLAFSL